MSADATLRRDLLVVGAVALALRLPLLGAFPGIAGDEANWALYARAAAHGLPVRLTADAAFVTELFAWLLAPAARVAEGSWAALRAVPALAVVLSALAARALGGPRAGRAMALALAVHPWSVLWSRTVSVPYALSLCCAVIGPLLLLDAHARARWGRAFAGWQLLGLSLHFSPLGAPTMAFCGLATLRARWRPWGAMLLGAAHGLFVVRGVLAVPHAARQGASVGLARGAMGALRMIAAQLSGVSSLRHVAGASRVLELAGAAVVLAVVLGAMRAESLGRKALALLLASCVALPVMLVPARAWSMPTIDADRYGFAVLAPMVLLLGAMASSRDRAARWSAWAMVACCAVGTAALAAHAWRGGGGDLGLRVADGGGRYRGWQRPAGGGAVVDRAIDAVMRDARGQRAVIAYQDYAFHAIRARTVGRAGVRHRFGEPDARDGERVYWLLYRDEAFARGAMNAQIALRRRVRDAGTRVVTGWAMPDGTPWVELRASE